MNQVIDSEGMRESTDSKYSEMNNVTGQIKPTLRPGTNLKPCSIYGRLVHGNGEINRICKTIQFGAYERNQTRPKLFARLSQYNN